MATVAPDCPRTAAVAENSIAPEGVVESWPTFSYQTDGPEAGVDSAIECGVTPPV